MKETLPDSSTRHYLAGLYPSWKRLPPATSRICEPNCARASARLLSLFSCRCFPSFRNSLTKRGVTLLLSMVPGESLKAFQIAIDFLNEGAPLIKHP